MNIINIQDLINKSGIRQPEPNRMATQYQLAAISRVTGLKLALGTSYDDAAQQAFSFAFEHLSAGQGSGMGQALKALYILGYIKGGPESTLRVNDEEYVIKMELKGDDWAINCNGELHILKEWGTQQELLMVQTMAKHHQELTSL